MARLTNADLEREYEIGYGAGKGAAEAKILHELIEMQTVVKRQLDAPQLSHKTYRQVLEDVAERLVSLVGP